MSGFTLPGSSCTCQLSSSSPTLSLHNFIYLLFIYLFILIPCLLRLGPHSDTVFILLLHLAPPNGFFELWKCFTCMGMKWNCLLEASEGCGVVAGWVCIWFSWIVGSQCCLLYVSPAELQKWFIILYHPSSGQIYHTLGQDPSHLDNDITQYMQHGMSYGILVHHLPLLTSVHPFFFHPDCFCPSPSPTDKACPWLISVKIGYHPQISQPWPGLLPHYCGGNVEKCGGRDKQ